MNWRLFFRDMCREWNYSSPSYYTSRVWIRIWQRWFDAKGGVWMQRYVMALLTPADFVNRLWRAWQWQRKLSAFKAETRRVMEAK